MTVPNNRDAILQHFQGKWFRKTQNNEVISFTIDGERISNIEGAVYNIDEGYFTLAFNNENLKWQLTSPVFGINSVLVNFEKDSFTILLRNGTDIVPAVNITETFHQFVSFDKRLNK